MFHRAVVAVLAVAALALAAAPAGAEIFDKGKFAEPFSFSYSSCGFPIDVSGEISGLYRLRTGKHNDESAFLGLENVFQREVHTNPETGEWFVVRVHFLFNEVKATRVEGNVFKFVLVEAGQPFVVEDSSGNVVVRSRGSLRAYVLFDTGGDAVPGGTLVEFLGEDVDGPHPASWNDLCDIATELIGST